jgi:RNA polymerase sigma-70 factor (ECF subfamily)
MSGSPAIDSRERCSGDGAGGAEASSAMTGLSQATVDVASEPVDPELAARGMLARGDCKGAITALMDAHGEAVFGFCVRVLRDRSLAEDVFQHVFLEAYRDIARFQAHSTFPAWLFGIASHRCQDALRSQRRRRHRLESNDQAAVRFADPCAASNEQLERARIIAALEECLRRLSEDVRIAVLLRFQQGMSYEEMSELLETKPNTLHVRVARALPALRRCLEAKGWTDA